MIEPACTYMYQAVSGSTSEIISTNQPLHIEVYKKGADNSNNKAAVLTGVAVPVPIAVSCYVVDKKR